MTLYIIKYKIQLKTILYDNYEENLAKGDEIHFIAAK